ncbi:Uncharacterised protein [Mycobacterium tuberculosis]|nr:Uncharacterised protein [Mycobacterium tuberculosis]
MVVGGLVAGSWAACESEIVVEISERVRRRIRADFPHHVPRVAEALAELTSGVFEGEARDSIHIERIQVAALIMARGHLGELDEAVALGHRDWRDLLVAAGLGDEGWEELVENELLVEPAPHAWIARTGRPGGQRPGS